MARILISDEKARDAGLVDFLERPCLEPRNGYVATFNPSGAPKKRLRMMVWFS